MAVSSRIAQKILQGLLLFQRHCGYFPVFLVRTKLRDLCFPVSLFTSWNLFDLCLISANLRVSSMLRKFATTQINGLNSIAGFYGESPKSFILFSQTAGSNQRNLVRLSQSPLEWKYRATIVGFPIFVLCWDPQDNQNLLIICRIHYCRCSGGREQILDDDLVKMIVFPD